MVPDREGRMADVALGYREPLSYFGDGPCMGKVPGRYANRIAGGRFTLDGKEYVLPVNNGPNHLHGGPEGFQNKVWESREHDGGVEFMYFSEDGEMGYPGNVKAVARYEMVGSLRTHADTHCRDRCPYRSESHEPCLLQPGRCKGTETSSTTN